MFTGIIEEVAEVTNITKDSGNIQITIKSKLTSELKIDQSVSHNGVCLTVVGINEDLYTVTAIEETLAKTNLGLLNQGDSINLERAMKMGSRLDGHIVQGHIDQTASCKEIREKDGSWEYTFLYDQNKGNITIEKGSITINGVSLTVVNSRENCFSVAIIPYTYKNTTFYSIKTGTKVNLEFDVVGKYVKRLFELSN